MSTGFLRIPKTPTFRASASTRSSWNPVIKRKGIVAVVGDAIFAGSIGRGNQSWDIAKQKVREQILSLPPATLICPGHGPLTTVAEEKEHNPFFV